MTKARKKTSKAAGRLGISAEPPEPDAKPAGPRKMTGFRLPPDLVAQVKALAVVTGQDMQDLAAEALQQYVSAAVKGLDKAKRAALEMLAEQFGQDS